VTRDWGLGNGVFPMAPGGRLILSFVVSVTFVDFVPKVRVLYLRNLWPGFRVCRALALGVQYVA